MKPRVPLTKDEIAFIKQNVGAISKSSIARQLGRPLSTVYALCRRLSAAGWTDRGKLPPWTPEHESILVHIFRQSDISFKVKVATASEATGHSPSAVIARVYTLRDNGIFIPSYRHRRHRTK